MDGLEAFSVDSLMQRVRDYGGAKSFGWRTFDTQGLGFRPGELSIVAGRTGHGKSTVVFNLLVHWLECYEGETFVLFSYEIPIEAVLLKMLSVIVRKQSGTSWAYQDIQSWIQGDKSVVAGRSEAELQRAVDTLRGWEQRLVVLYHPEWHAERLDRFARELVARLNNRLGGILVDYLQLVPPPPGEYETREHQVEEVAKRLKRLAANLDCPVVAAAQIGREVAQLSELIPPGNLEDEKVLQAIAKRRPQLHHLRQGGGEQEADMVFGILNYRADFLAARKETGEDQYWTRDTGAAGPFEVAIIKNRFGALGIASLVLESQTGYLRDPGVFGH